MLLWILGPIRAVFLPDSSLKWQWNSDFDLVKRVVSIKNDFRQVVHYLVLKLIKIWILGSIRANSSARFEPKTDMEIDFVKKDQKFCLKI